MNSTKNKRAIIVGLFIFIGLAIFIVTVLTLGGQKKTFKKAIVVKAIFDDVNGLQKGNNIWFSGVKIGTIKKISFYGKSQVLVDMNIDESAQEYVRKDAKAKISSDGLIGNKIIVIYAGTVQSPQVEPGDMLGVEKAVNSEEMMTTLQANNRNILDITNDFKSVSKGIVEGRGTVGQLLSDDELMVQLQTTMQQLRKASINTAQLTSTVSNYAARLNSKGSLADDLITDTTIIPRLRATARQIDEVSRTANAVVANLNTTTNDINAGLNSSKSPVGMLLHDEAAAADVKMTLQNLQTSSQKLDENLEALQHNFLLRGFFRKKAKREAKEKEELEKVKAAINN